MKKIQSSKGSKHFQKTLNIETPLSSPTGFSKKINALNSPTQTHRNENSERKRLGFFQEMEDTKKLTFVELVNLMVNDEEFKKKLKNRKNKGKS